MSVCDECRGTGNVLSATVCCPLCDGTGEQPGDEQVSRGYHISGAAVLLTSAAISCWFYWRLFRWLWGIL